MRGPAPALLAAAGAVLLVAAVVGFLSGRSGSGGEGEAAGANLASVGGLELGFPDGWRRPAQSRSIPGLELQNSLALAPEGTGERQLIAGRANATGPTLLPSSFLRRLERTPRGEPVKLDTLEAYRYDDLRPRGFDGRLTLYTVPTNAGVATVACSAPAAEAAAFLPRCERVARTLQLTEGQAFPIGPDEKYAEVLDDALGNLSTKRASERNQLAKAKTPRGQGNVAAKLATAYAAAARPLARAKVSPADRPAHEQLVTVLRRIASSYTGLASAARAGQRSRYDSAREDIRGREAALRRALARLEALGYKVG
jgi:hypothetical protein